MKPPLIRLARLLRPIRGSMSYWEPGEIVKARQMWGRRYIIERVKWRPSGLVKGGLPAINRCAGVPVGALRFLKPPRPRMRPGITENACIQVISSVVMEHFKGTTWNELIGSGQNKRVSTARLVIYFLAGKRGVSPTQLARTFRHDPKVPRDAPNMMRLKTEADEKFNRVVNHLDRLCEERINKLLPA